MAVVLPVSLDAQETAAAILRSSGSGVLVNNNPAPTSIALFQDDVIETPQKAVARIELSGSTADINADTVVQFEGDELVFDHGSLSVSTAKGLRVRVGCLTVSPVNSSNETLFEVVDRDGKVTVHATERDVYIHAASKNSKKVTSPSQSTRELVHAGEQKSRQEGCAPAATKAPATGAVLNGPWPIAAAAVAIGGTTVWVLCKDDDPISPSSPSRRGPCPIP